MRRPLVARLLRTLAVLAAIVVVGTVAARTHRLVDLTEEQSLTLTSSTERVLAALDRDVDITAFLRRDEPGRVEAATLLDRYRKESSHIDWEVVDPDESPGEVARLGIDPVFGGVAFEAGEALERVPAVTEQDITAGLARLVRGRGAELCVTTGHGEPTLGEATALLEREGYRINVVDLLARPEVPATCTAVLLAGATEPLGAANAALAAWTDADGKLLVLADPVADVDLSALLEPHALGLQRGVVFEGDAASVVNADVTAPIVRTYSSGHPIVRRLAPTYFPGVQAVLVDDEAAAAVPGLTVSRLADTSPTSYLETAPVAPVFTEDADVAGPLTVAATAERTRNDGQRILRTRVVVIADVDFATDRFLGDAANADLLVRSVAWLTLDDDLLALSANLPSDRPLALTDGRLTYARALTAGIVPTLFLVAGALVWALRRTR